MMPLPWMFSFFLVFGFIYFLFLYFSYYSFSNIVECKFLAPKIFFLPW